MVTVWIDFQSVGDTPMESDTMGRVLTAALIENMEDLVVDLRSRTLIGNPAHGGEHVYELY